MFIKDNFERKTPKSQNLSRAILNTLVMNFALLLHCLSLNKILFSTVKTKPNSKVG